LLDKQAKANAELQIKFTNKVYDAEQKLAEQEDARANKSQQERFDRINKNNNSIHKQEIYNIEENAKMEAEADDRKFKRLIRNATQEREQQKRISKTSGETSGGVLGATKGGDRTLETARIQRERQLKTENYKTAQSVAPTQRDREKLAAQQAAREMPSLAEQMQGGLNGIDPSQLAGAAAAGKFERDRAFGPAKMGGITQGKLGEEQGSVSKETLSALKALVDLMKSGTVVK